MHLLNDETMQAICWTLIHSLWQGLLLAVFAGIIIMLTKKSSSVLRYNLLSGLFFLFIVIVSITFVNQLQVAAGNHQTNNAALTLTAEQINNITSQQAGEISSDKNYFSTFVNYFNRHASLIVMIWFIILSAQCIKLIANAAYIQRIRHYKTYQPSNHWKRKMNELAERLQIKKQVRLLQSGIVKVPVMVGFFKPMILFPFSLMSQLPPEQIEAVLLHELAHIKRKDYFVNLLQNFAEIIFFFNPGVLWVSSLIKDERENCCDDIAINQTKSKKEFIHALVSFQEYNIGSKYTLAFPGRKNHLLNRVKRIITNNNKALNNMEKISLAAGIVIISFATIAFTRTPQKEEIKKVSAIGTAPKTANITDTIPDEVKSISHVTYVDKIDGKEYRLVMSNDKVTELYVDDKKVPDEKMGDYKEVIDKILIKAKADKDKLDAEDLQLAKDKEKLMEEQERMEKEQNEMRELQEKNFSRDTMERLNREHAELDAKMQELKEQQELIDRKEIEKSNKEQAELFAKMEELKKQQELVSMKEMEKANLDQQQQLKQHNAELMALVEELKKQQRIMKQEAIIMSQKDSKKQVELLNKQIIELKNEQIKIEQQRKKIDKILLDQDRGGISIPATPATASVQLSGSVLVTPPVAPKTSIAAVLAIKPFEDTKPLKQIINELIDEKIISSRNNLSIILNNEMLKVNDIIQSEELHARLKDKYLKGVKDHVIYSKRDGSTHADINVDSGSSHADLKENK